MRLYTISETQNLAFVPGKNSKGAFIKLEARFVTIRKEKVMEGSSRKRIVEFVVSILIIIVAPIAFPPVVQYIGFDPGSWATIYAGTVGIGFFIYFMGFDLEPIDGDDCPLIVPIIVSAIIGFVCLGFGKCSVAAQYETLNVKIATIELSGKTISLDPPQKIELTVSKSEMEKIIKSQMIKETK